MDGREQAPPETGNWKLECPVVDIPRPPSQPLAFLALLPFALLAAWHVLPTCNLLGF